MIRDVYARQRSVLLLTVVTLGLGCSSEAHPGSMTGSPSGGSSAAGAPSAGNGGSQAGTSAGNQGGASAGVAGTSSPTNGGLGGSSQAGTSTSGGSSPGGGSSNGGASAGATTTGGSGGSASGADSSVATALDGLRIDAPCDGSPAATDGETCDHTVLMSNRFQATKEVSIVGNAGSTYDVTLRIRGVVEPTSVSGGTRPDTSTLTYKNTMWRKVPYTVGGTVQSPDYQAWRLSVAEPKQDYFLNDYQNTAHNVFKLDYQVTLPMAANTKVTLDVTDANERQIVNYEKYALEGIPGSMNFGQFVQLEVVSVQPR